MPVSGAMRESGARFRVAAIALAVFALAQPLNLLLRALELRRWLDWLVVLGIRNALEIALCFLGVWAAHRFGVARGARELGLCAPRRRALAFAFVACAPMLVAFALAFDVNPELNTLSVAVGCFVAPFAEEVLFRGYLFRQLDRRARLGFWPSALLPSLLFALGHLHQSNDPSELLGIVAITGSGGVAFCWMFTRWQDNLWVPFGLHAGMNLWWEVFAVDDGALGGWLANGARLTTAALAIAMTLCKDRIWSPLPEEADNIALGEQ
jgi:membrane protease YdiL (CAAX protease family)